MYRLERMSAQGQATEPAPKIIAVIFVFQFAGL